MAEVVKGQCKDAGGGEYLYAARLLPSRAIVCGGSGFNEVRVFNRDTKMVSLCIISQVQGAYTFITFMLQ